MLAPRGCDSRAGRRTGYSFGGAIPGVRALLSWLWWPPRPGARPVHSQGGAAVAARKHPTTQSPWSRLLLHFDAAAASAAGGMPGETIAPHSFRGAGDVRRRQHRRVDSIPVAHAPVKVATAEAGRRETREGEEVIVDCIVATHARRPRSGRLVCWILIQDVVGAQRELPVSRRVPQLHVGHPHRLYCQVVAGIGTRGEDLPVPVGADGGAEDIFLPFR